MTGRSSRPAVTIQLSLSPKHSGVWMSLSSIRIHKFGNWAFRICTIAACMIMLACTASAHTAAIGTVRGSVVDQDTAIIPGATVVLLPVSGATITAKAGSDGTFRVPAPAGTYTVTVT